MAARHPLTDPMAGQGLLRCHLVGLGRGRRRSPHTLQGQSGRAEAARPRTLSSSPLGGELVSEDESVQEGGDTPRQARQNVHGLRSDRGHHEVAGLK